MFFGIDTTALTQVSSVPSIISAAEMIFPVSESVAGAFIHFSVFLCDAHFSSHDSTPANDSAYLALKGLAGMAPCASAEDLEQLGDRILAYGTGSAIAPYLLRLVYLCYAATSMFGDLSPKVKTKLRRVELQIVPKPDMSGLIELAQIAKDSFRDQCQAVAYSALLELVRRLEAVTE
jgi:hypothetical protein